MRLQKKLLGALLASSIVIGFAACGGMLVQNYTRVVGRGRPSVSADSATLVVARRRGMGEMITLLDEQGSVLGQLYVNQWTRIPLPPGHHRIYAMTANFEAGSVIDVELEAGRLYHAEVPIVRRPLIAVAPRHEDRWQHRWQWIDESDQVELDTSQLALLESELPLALRQTVIRNADAEFASLDPAHRDEYQLTAADGEAL